MQIKRVQEEEKAAAGGIVLQFSHERASKQPPSWETLEINHGILGRTIWVGRIRKKDQDQLFPERAEYFLKPHLSAEDSLGARKSRGIVSRDY